MKHKNWPWAVMNLGLLGLVALALYFTKSLWAFVGLFFLFSTRPTQVEAKCPKCGHEFTATTKDEDEEN